MKVHIFRRVTVMKGRYALGMSSKGEEAMSEQFQLQTYNCTQLYWCFVPGWLSFVSKSARTIDSRIQYTGIPIISATQRSFGLDSPDWKLERTLKEHSHFRLILS